MKLFFTLLSLFVSSGWCAAQTDTLSPKWKEGLVWKVTSKTVAPDKSTIGPDKEITYNTTTVQFLWEILSVNDTAVNISVLPLKINIESANDFTLEEAGLVVSGYEKLSVRKTPMIYQANQNGTIKKRDIENGNELLLKNEYFTNESDLIAVFPGDTTEEYDEYEEYDEDAPITSFQGANLEYWSLVEFFGKIVETIHSPYGEPVYLDSVINLQDYPEEKWETYQTGLSAMAKMMDVNGYTTFSKEEGSLTNKYELNMNLGSMMKKLLEQEESKKGKKKGKKGKESKAESALNSMQMEIKIEGSLTVEDVSFFPVKFLTELFTNISIEGESASFSATNELSFE